MNETRQTSLVHLFGESLARTPTERQTLLEDVARDDASIRDDLDRLLHVAGVSTSDPGPCMIGSYRVVGLLGEGGFCVVFEAEQSQPRRRVALKVLHPAITTPDTQRRFEFEARTLAHLQHPGIAQIYEAGTAITSAGSRSFFALELVRGLPLTAYVAREDLDLQSQVRLLIEICDAVQLAHQRGVIHRDLKPANVLVTESGRPKVLDFGVARTFDPDLQVATMQTRTGQILGTVPYMSPEQLSGEPDQIDTRSDVYALGVLLYRLVTGRLPFEVEGQSVLRAMQLIQDGEPLRARTINSAIPLDLEAILVKTLERNRERRYRSASELATDLGRFLNDEPILARHPTATYQLRKFARRNKAVVVGVTMTVLALIVGVVVSSVFAIGQSRALRAVAERETDLAALIDFQASMLQEIDVEQVGVELSLEVRRRAKAVSQAQPQSAVIDEDAVASFNAMLGHLNTTDVAVWALDHHVLKPAERRARASSDRPSVQASLFELLGDTYASLGLDGDALPLQQASFQGLREQNGDEDVDTIWSAIGVVTSLSELGRYDDALTLADWAVTTSRRTLGDDHRATIVAVSGMGTIFSSQGQDLEALRSLEEAVDTARRVLGDDDEDTLTVANNLCVVLANLGRYEEADSELRQIVAASRRMFGDEHSQTIVALNNLGSVLIESGQHEDALPILQETVGTSRRALGAHHPTTLVSINNLGLVLAELGRDADAIVLLREAVEVTRETLGQYHPETVVSLVNLAALLTSLGKPEESIELCYEAVESSRHGEAPWQTQAALGELVACLQALDRHSEAMPYLEERYVANQFDLEEDHPDTLVSLAEWALGYTDIGEVERGLELLLEATRRARSALGTGHPDTMLVMFNLGITLDNMGRLAAAQRHLQEVAELARDHLGPDHPDTIDYVSAVADFYEAWSEADPAFGYDAELAAWRTLLNGTTDPTAPSGQ